MNYYTKENNIITMSADWKFDANCLETEEEIVRGYDGVLYLKSECPEKPQELIDEELSQQLRSKRDSLLSSSDWTQMPDSPLSQEQKTKWTEYRQYLRDIPQQEGFPNIEVMSFEEFQQDLE